MAFTHLIFPEQEIYILIREKANNKMCSVKKLKKIGQAKNAEKEDSGKKHRASKSRQASMVPTDKKISRL